MNEQATKGYAAEQCAVKVWMHDGGVSIIPSHLRCAPFTRKGWPDKRSKRYGEFMQWVASIETTP